MSGISAELSKKKASIRPYPPLDIFCQVAHAVIPVSDLDNHEIDPGLAVFVFLLDGSGNRGLGFKFIINIGVDVEDIHRTDAFNLGFTYNPVVHPQEFVDENRLREEMPEGFAAANTQFADVPGVKVDSFLMHVRSIHETQLVFCHSTIFYFCHVSSPRNAGDETAMGMHVETPSGSPAQSGLWAKPERITPCGGLFHDAGCYSFQGRSNTSENIQLVPMKIYTSENNIRIGTCVR